MTYKKYRFGISSAVDYFADIQKLLHLFSKYGFRFVSIGADTRHNFFPDNEKFSTMIGWINENNLEIDSIHVPFGPEYDLANPEDNKRKLAIKSVLEFLEYADAGNIPIAILHPHHYLIDSPQVALDKSTESLRKIVSRKPQRIRLAIENLPDKRGSWIADQLLTLFDSNSFGFCYDSSHENLSGPPFHLLEKHYARLITCHLSDNNGSFDEHLIPGRGNIDWLKMKTYFDRSESFADILFEVGTGEALTEPVEDYVRMISLKAEEIFG